MKKIMNFFVLVAAAVMALVSCQKNEIEGPVKQEVHFTINAGISTKTIITDNGDGTYTPSWTGDEQLGVLFSAPNADTKAGNVVSFDNKSEAGETASFQGSTTVTENGTFYSFYPASAFNRGYGEGDARLDLEPEQKPSATSFDPSCDILVAKPYDYEVNDGQVVVDELYFKRLMSVLRIDLNSDFEDVKGEFVESVSFTAGDVKIVGYARVFLDNPDFTTQNWASSGSEYCTVTARYDTDVVSVAGTDNSVYLVIAPVTISAGKELTFEIKTKNYNISKTVTVPADMKFVAGNVNKIKLTIEPENCEAVDTSIDYSGDWLITGVKDEQVYAAGAYVSGANNLNVTVPITISDGKINEVDGLAGCKMTITKVTEGEYEGMYTIEDANSTEETRSYLYAAGSASSGSNYLKSTNELSIDTYWDITKNDDGTYEIVANDSDAKSNIIRFNSSSTLFNCYSSGQQPITLYPYDMVVPDTTPSINVEETLELTSAESEGTISVTYKNLEGLEAAAYSDAACTTECAWLLASWESNAVYYVAEANEGEERTAYIQIYALDAESNEYTKVITVTQAAKAAEGAAYYEKVTSAPADWSGEYLLVCESMLYLFDGSLTTVDSSPNYIQLQSIPERLSYNDYSKYAVTIAKYDTGYSIKTASGYFIGSTSTTSSTINSSLSTQYVNTLSFDNGMVKIAGAGSRVFNYNAQSGRFRYFASSSTPLVSAYKLVGANSGGEGGSTPEPELQERNLAFSAAAATATVGEDFTEPTLSGATDGVVYSSSNTAVAEVDSETGEVTLLTAGETTITAAAEADATYKAGEASYTLTVLSQGSGDSRYYVKVETTTPGAGTYLYVSKKSYAFTGDVSDNSYGAVSLVTVDDDNKILSTEEVDAYAIVLEEGATPGQYAVKLPNGEYLVTSTSKPSSSTTKYYMTYDTEKGLSSVNNTGYYFQGNNSSFKFRWYKDTQTKAYLYKLN